MRRMNTRLDFLLIPLVYFIAGASSLAGVATTFFYKDDLGLSLEQLGVLSAVSIVPWSIKPLYGLLSDRLPVFGLRRKPYLVLSGLLSSAGYLGLSLVATNFWHVLFFDVLSAIGFALADVIVDGMVVERSRTQAEAGKLQSICRASIMFGALLVAYSSGVLVESIGARKVFLWTATLPLITTGLALCIRETRTHLECASIRATYHSLKKAFTPAIVWSAVFLFIWRATPSSGGALSYYMIDVLDFTPEFFGRLSVISRLMGIVGVLFFRKFLISLSLRSVFVGVVAASILLSLPSLGLVYGWYELLGVSPRFFAMADTLISAPLTEIGFLPLLVLAARICPKGVEATMFALLASLMNIGLAVSDIGGSLLVNFFNVHQATEALPANYENLDLVLWVAILSSAIPLPLLWLVPDVRREETPTADVIPELSGDVLANRTPAMPG